MTKVKVKIGFASLNYAGASGTIIDLPLSEAKSLEHSGIVEIIEEQERPVAFETAAAAKRAVKTATKR